MSGFHVDFANLFGSGLISISLFKLQVNASKYQSLYSAQIPSSKGS